jgi:hypothetical protein
MGTLNIICKYDEDIDYFKLSITTALSIIVFK